MEITQQTYRIAGRVTSIKTEQGNTTVDIDSTATGHIPPPGVDGPLNNYFYQPGDLTDAEIAILNNAHETNAGVIVYFTGDRTVTSVISTVSLTINNTSGVDLVTAMVQGGLNNQNVAQLKWLNMSDTATWELPSSPTSKKDLYPYMLDIPNGKSVTVYVPSYSERVGFRCLVAETAYKSDALKTYEGINYMAFPNLITAAYKFDKFEAGLTEGVPGIWNITSVDFLAIPMQLSKGTKKVGYKDGVTASGIYDKLTDLGTPYSTGGTMSPNTNGHIYRFFSPVHISGANTCLDTQISTGLTSLNGNITTTVHYGAFTFSHFTASSTSIGGKVTGTISCNTDTAGTITINNLTTANALAGEVGSEGDPEKLAFGALLAAAACRGVLGKPEHWGDITYTATQCATPWDYYPSDQQFDKYAKVIHEYSIGGKNYAFSYDDYFSDEAGFNVVTGEVVNLNILSLSGTMTASPNPTPPVKTGCLMINIPEGVTKNVGDMSIDGKDLNGVTNGLCFLNDMVIIKFSNYPPKLTNPEIHINLKTGTLTYWQNGAIDPLLSIIGLVFSSSTRVLNFGTTSKWPIK